MRMQALKILEDDTQCDIIKIGGLIRNKVIWEASIISQPGSAPLLMHGLYPRAQPGVPVSCSRYVAKVKKLLSSVHVLLSRRQGDMW